MTAGVASAPERRLGRSVPGRIRATMLVVLALAAIPLARSMAGSTLALSIASGCLAVINACSLAQLGKRTDVAAGHLVNLALVVAGLLAVRSPGLSLAASSWVVGSLCLALFALACSSLPNRSAVLAFASQQLSLGAMLILWRVAREMPPHLLSSVADTAVTRGFRISFLGLLALAPMTSLAAAFGWKRRFSVLAAVCVGQIGIGLIDIGGASGFAILLILGVAVAVAFVGLLIAVALLGPKAESAERVSE